MVKIMGIKTRQPNIHTNQAGEPPFPEALPPSEIYTQNNDLRNYANPTIISFPTRCKNLTV